MSFVNAILEDSEAFFDTPAVDLTDEPEATVGLEERRSDDQVATARLDKLEDYVREMLRKSLADNLMFSRLREDVDFEKNKLKEDRLIINHLRAKDPPREQKEKIEFWKNIAAEVFEGLIPDFSGVVQWVSVGRNPRDGADFSTLEVRLDSVKSSADIRRAFAGKQKAKTLEGICEDIFVTNCITKSTRVRIEILKAIARKITTDDDLAYVAGFISRPVMHIKRNTKGSFPHKTFTYVEAVVRYGDLMRTEDLRVAYDRARPFAGELEQNFIILTEKGLSETPRAAPNTSGSFGRGSWGARGTWRGGRGGRGGGGRGGKTNKRPIEDDAGEGTSEKRKK